MRNFLYFGLVFVISFEFLWLLVGVVIYFNLDKIIGNYVFSLKFNDDFAKWLILAPVSLFVWIFREARSLLIGDKESIRILTDWEGYWQLKIHVYVNLIYSSVFIVLCVIPVLVDMWISDIRYLLLFIVGLLGLLISARDLYFASIRVKEFVGKLRNP